jgi:predicted transcriptional regulator
MGTEVNEHKTRRMIFNHITNYPGVSFGIIKRVFGLADSTLRYHLHYLESHKDIKSFIKGKNKCYYPIQSYVFDSRGVISSEPDHGVHKLTNTQERLIDTIQRNPGISQKELILHTGLKRITIAHNIRKLLDFGVVRKEPNGRHICYHYISDSELREKILRRLTTKLLNDEIDEKTFLALKRKLE